ncbi:MAG: hypothetical protein R2851_15520 [Caldilineaceae bacterium]
MAYGTPFISGKDGLYNEFNGKPIPGTLLISAIGIVPDMQRAVTSDLKQAGNAVYLLGETRPDLGGSLFFAEMGLDGGFAPAMPGRRGNATRAAQKPSAPALSNPATTSAKLTWPSCWRVCLGRLRAEIEIERLEIEIG